MNPQRRCFVPLVLVLILASAPPRGRLEAADPVPPPELRKLHALLVVDTLADLGESVVIDGNHMEYLLKGGFPRNRLTITKLTGKDVTKKTILQYYQQLKAEPTDALLFFYAGHGADDPAKGHYLALQKAMTEPLVRSDLRKAMEAKHAGLVVLLTDCCSEKYPYRKAWPEAKRYVLVEPGEAKEVSPVLSCLFLRHRGVVDITAAADNTCAFGDDEKGGLFTRTVYKLLTNPPPGGVDKPDQFVSWNEFFERLQKDTEKVASTWLRKARSHGDEVPANQATQKPRAFALSVGGSATPAATELTVTLLNKDKQAYGYEYRWSGDKEWQKAVLPAEGTQTYTAPASRAGKEPPVLEVRFDNGEEHQMKVGKKYGYSRAK